VLDPNDTSGLGSFNNKTTLTDDGKSKDDTYSPGDDNGSVNIILNIPPF